MTLRSLEQQNSGMGKIEGKDSEGEWLSLGVKWGPGGTFMKSQ